MPSPIYKDVKVVIGKDMIPTTAWPHVRKAMQKAGIPEFRISRLFKACMLVRDDMDQFIKTLSEWVKVEVE